MENLSKQYPLKAAVSLMSFRLHSGRRVPAAARHYKTRCLSVEPTDQPGLPTANASRYFRFGNFANIFPPTTREASGYGRGSVSVRSLPKSQWNWLL